MSGQTLVPHTHRSPIVNLAGPQSISRLTPRMADLMSWVILISRKMDVQAI